MIGVTAEPGQTTQRIAEVLPMRLKVAGTFVALGLWCGAAPAAAREFSHAVVAADHPLASAAGAEILQQGGSVVDAAVATSFALAVVRPESCGLGGGGFMLIWNVDLQEAVALDYRERAPTAATRDMFTQPGVDPSASRRGGLAVAVPGTVAGLCFVLERYGTMNLRQVLAPALRLARGEIPVDAAMRAAVDDVRIDLRAVPEAHERYAPLFARYLDPITSRREFRSPLADVLERIAAEGPAAFYVGSVASAIVSTVRSQGGIITADDLRHTRPIHRRALLGKRDDMTVVTMPPPSSGGVALLESLGILDAYTAAHPDRSLTILGHNSPGYIHLVTEALKHAFADRARYLGDSEFVTVPVRKLLDPAALAAMATQIDMQATAASESYGRHTLPDDAGTSHFSIIDAAGNAVACTETINTAYGSLVVVPEYGIVLNNQMDDFTTAPGQPNAFGLIQSDANAISPNKKPLSSMTPTILVRDGKAVYAAGASGGPRIISVTLQVLLNMTEFDMSPQAAVAAARFHHQWSPDELKLEPSFDPDVVTELEQKGHRIVRADKLAAAQAAAHTAAGLSAGSDPRKGGAPSGY